MTERTASCRCGQLKATVTGDPAWLSVCHCLDCKKRSGSSFATQARWPAEQVQVEGRCKDWVKIGDSGNRATFTFCPDCGSDIHYRVEDELSHMIAIPLGAFDDPFFGLPKYSVFETRKHPWLQIVGDIEHYD